MDFGRSGVSFWTGSRLASRTVSVVFWMLALLAAMGLSRLIPPIQSPDEDSHIGRAYLISQGDLLLQGVPPVSTGAINTGINGKGATADDPQASHDGRRFGGFVDEGLSSFVAAHLDLARQSDKRFTAAEKAQLGQMKWSGKKQFQVLSGTGYYFPAVYAPQALGLAIGHKLSLSVGRSYQLARALTLLVCFALLGLACRQLTPNPLLVSVLLLPMSMFQLLSPTIDGLTTSLSVLATSLFLKSADPGRGHSAPASWGMAICIFLLATSRTHLLPLLMLPFYLAWRRQSRRDLYLGCWITVGAVAWTLFALQSTGEARVVRDHTTAELLLHYATDPMAFFKVVLASLNDSDLFIFYERSFVGVLGWLDTWLPAYFYPALWVGLAMCGLATVSVASLQRDWSARLLLAAVAIACTGLIFLALLVTWTPHPALLVKGVQGRYFVVPAILLSGVMCGVSTVQSPLRKWLGSLAIAGFAVSSLTALTMTLLSRYH